MIYTRAQLGSRVSNIRARIRLKEDEMITIVVKPQTPLKSSLEDPPVTPLDFPNVAFALIPSPPSPPPSPHRNVGF